MTVSDAPTSVPLPRATGRPTPANAANQQQRYVQGTLALDYCLANGLSATPGSPALSPVLSIVDPDTAAPNATPAHEWAGRFLQAVIEVIACDRPLTQLVRWTNEQVYAEIAARKESVAASRRGGKSQSHTIRAARQQVATVHVHHPVGEVAEVSARVSLGRRSRAIAARLDLHRGRWMCTAISFG